LNLDEEEPDSSQINWDYLSESETHTGCPYKGEASYFHAMINGKRYEDIAWWYRFPVTESMLIQGMLCFYADKVDMWVDGEKKGTRAEIMARAKKEIEASAQAKDDHSSECDC
jgi:hypothetical protein